MAKLILFTVFLLTFSNGYCANGEIRSMTTKINGRTVVVRYQDIDGQLQIIEAKELTKDMLKNQPAEQG